MRILYAVSSIGLGHVARSRALAEALKRLKPGITVEFLAPPPANRYLEAWGWKPHPVSGSLEPISPIVDEFYERTGKGLINLRMALKEHEVARRNAELVDQYIDYDSYDAAVLDESWELLESEAFMESGVLKIYLADFLAYPYRPSYLAVALAVNRFLKRRLEKMHLCLFAGFPEKLEGRWFPLLGESLERWSRGRVRVVGPLPPVLPDELVTRINARRRLGLGVDDLAILASLGGTRAGHEILGITFRGAERLAEKLGGSVSMVVAPGASLERVPVRGGKVDTVILEGSRRFELSRLLRAFDASVSPAGLTTIAGLAAAGVPGILVPLPSHFEQEENARLAVKKWGWFRSARLSWLNPEWIADSIVEVSRSRPEEGDRGLFHNLKEAARIVLSSLEAGPT